MKTLTTLSSIVALLFAAVPAANAADAATIYKSKCASCHGADGKGQTKMGKKSKALDYTTAAGQKWSDAAGVKAILEGKGKMKAFKGKVSPEEAAALVKYIRGFKK